MFNFDNINKLLSIFIGDNDIPAVFLRVLMLWYIYTVKYYSTIKKQEILPFATAWMDLENIMLSEIRQSEKDKCYMISSICGI